MSISIDGYKGLRIASATGNMQIKLNNKEVLGHSKGVTLALGVKEDDFEFNDDYERQAIAFYMKHAGESWSKYLNEEDSKNLRELKGLFERKMARFKTKAKIRAMAEIDREFA